MMYNISVICFVENYPSMYFLPSLLQVLHSTDPREMYQRVKYTRDLMFIFFFLLSKGPIEIRLINMCDRSTVKRTFFVRAA